MITIVLLLLCIHIISIDGINCNADCRCTTPETCDLNCNADNICHEHSINYNGYTLTCKPGYPCIINCLKDSACENAIVNGSLATDVTINCDDWEGCKRTTVHCGSGHCAINCLNTKGRQCLKTVVNCASSKSCILTCTANGWETCRDIKVNVQNTNSYHCNGPETEFFCNELPDAFTVESTIPTEMPTNVPTTVQPSEITTMEMPSISPVAKIIAEFPTPNAHSIYSSGPTTEHPTIAPTTARAQLKDGIIGTAFLTTNDSRDTDNDEILISDGYLNTSLIIGVSIGVAILYTFIICVICKLCRISTTRKSNKKVQQTVLTTDIGVSQINIVSLQPKDKYLSDAQKQKYYKTSRENNGNNINVNTNHIIESDSGASIIFNECLSNAPKIEETNNKFTVQSPICSEGRPPQPTNIRQPTTDDAEQLMYLDDESENENQNGYTNDPVRNVNVNTHIHSTGNSNGFHDFNNMKIVYDVRNIES